MTRRIGIALAFMAFAGWLALAQQPAAKFEVASVKKAETDAPPGDIPHNMDSSPGHLTMRNAPLRYCLEWAYSLQDYEIQGPDWIKSDERYDIFAKAAGPATDEEMRPMLAALLLERFQMKVHRETRELPAYVLLPGKGPAKVTESAADSQPKLIGGKNGLTFQHFPISRFTFMLTRRMDHPVLDQTGLKGIYDYTVDISGLSEFSGPPNPEATSIFGAIQQDLGLKLEYHKQQPISVL